MFESYFFYPRSLADGMVVIAQGALSEVLDAGIEMLDQMVCSTHCPGHTLLSASKTYDLHSSELSADVLVVPNLQNGGSR